MKNSFHSLTWIKFYCGSFYENIQTIIDYGYI